MPPLEGGSFTPSFSSAALRAVSPVEPWSLDCTLSNCCFRPSCAASCTSSECSCRVTSPLFVEIVLLPPLRISSSCSWAARLAVRQRALDLRGGEHLRRDLHGERAQTVGRGRREPFDFRGQHALQFFGNVDLGEQFVDEQVAERPSAIFGSASSRELVFVQLFVFKHLPVHPHRQRREHPTATAQARITSTSHRRECGAGRFGARSAGGSAAAGRLACLRHHSTRQWRGATLSPRPRYASYLTMRFHRFYLLTQADQHATRQCVPITPTQPNADIEASADNRRSERRRRNRQSIELPAPRTVILQQTFSAPPAEPASPDHDERAAVFPSEIGRRTRFRRTAASPSFGLLALLPFLAGLAVGERSDVRVFGVGLRIVLPDANVPTSASSGWACGSSCPDANVPTSASSGWACGSSCPDANVPTFSDGSDVDMLPPTSIVDRAPSVTLWHRHRSRRR